MKGRESELEKKSPQGERQAAQQVSKARKTKPEPQTVEPVYVNVGDPGSLLHGIHQFFALLAYPAKEEHSLRSRFLCDLYAEMYKKYADRGGGHAERIPKTYLQITRRQISGGWHWGFNRIGTRRLLAAVAAESLFDGGCMVPRVNPT